MFEHAEYQDLIISARSGDNDAIAQIISSLMPCVEAAAHSYSQSSLPAPDLIQEGLIGAVNAVFTFDESKGVKFSTYANRCISNSIISALRTANGKKHRALNSFVPLEDVSISADSQTSNPESLISMNERIDNIYHIINTRLTELERSAILLHIAGENTVQTAQKLGISEKSVSNALARARKKLHTALN